MALLKVGKSSVVQACPQTAGQHTRKVDTMQKSLVFSVLALVAATASAQEVGRVLSSTPVVQQVAVPRQVCNQQPGYYQQAPRSGAGAVLGAVAGGAVGNSIGGGSGRAVATVLGVLGGAMLGDNIEGGGAQQAYAAPQCSTQTVYENRSVAYNVVYEYAGRQYSVQMANDPGPTVPLQITPVGSVQPYAQQPQQYGAAPYPVEQAVVPAYGPPPQAYYPPRPYYSPIGVSLNFGFSNHRGWR